MKKILLGLFFAMFAFQVNAAILNWESTPTGVSAVADNAAVISGSSQHFDKGTAFSETWTFKSDTDIKAVSLTQEFFHSEFNPFSVTISGFGIAAPISAVGGVDSVKFTYLYKGVFDVIADEVYTIVVAGTAISDGVHYSTRVSAVPVPAAVWLFGSALMGLVGVSRRKSTAVAA